MTNRCHILSNLSIALPLGFFRFCPSPHLRCFQRPFPDPLNLFCSFFVVGTENVNGIMHPRKVNKTTPCRPSKFSLENSMFLRCMEYGEYINEKKERLQGESLLIQITGQKRCLCVCRCFGLSDTQF